MRSRNCLSSAESGSSISRMRGSNTIARASATRWRCPPDSSPTRRVPNPASRTVSSACSTLRAMSAFATRRIRSGKAMFSATLICGNNA